MNKIITAAVVLQLPQEVRDELISKAISEYLLAPRDNYGKTTRLQYQVNEAIDRAVKVVFDELLSKEPYKSRLEQLTRERLTKLFESTDGEAEKLVSSIIERAFANVAAQVKR